ncbi:MAG: hypothetical protein OXH09_01095 [Gammaproteobacteria bacterium]|nr:hypothetical protein [Gammaproteobacteria bacterium]
MLNQLLKFTLVSGFLLWLRRRWKWLVGCGAVIAAAMYLHAEFLAYVGALPPESNRAVAASEYISAAFFAKNLVILASLLAYFLVEMRASRRSWNRSRREVSTPQPSAGERTAAGSAAAANDNVADDGFDFLRHGRKLENRAEKIIKGKTSK